MIKDFFIKKENIFIFVVALVSIFFVVLGFLFLFFKTDSSDGPKVIPTDVKEINWNKFSSKTLDQRIEYPDYLHIKEQVVGINSGINITEFNTEDFLDYYSNQNQISFFPSGIDMPLVYGKTKESNFVSDSKQSYKVTEYLTLDDKVWAVMFVPEMSYKNWQSKGFIWIQSKIQNKQVVCQTNTGMIIEDMDCDMYAGQKVIYSGKISEQFLKTGYEIINKNYFK